MGANLSTVKDGRAHVATATAAPAYKTSSVNRRPAMPESRAPAPACAAYPPYYKTSGNNNLYNSAKSKAAPPAFDAFPPKMATTKKVIPFHSAARWREYFEASKQSNKLIVIYFTATWCGPCKYMEPTINDFAAKYNDVELVKIDVDELFNVSREFGVQTMPTFLFIKKGKEIGKVVGARIEELQRKIEKHRV